MSWPPTLFPEHRREKPWDPHSTDMEAIKDIHDERQEIIRKIWKEEEEDDGLDRVE